MSHKTIDVVCTMATCECAHELRLFWRALRTHHAKLPLIVGCTQALRTALQSHPCSHDAHTTWIACLDQYGPHIDRGVMERQPGVWYASRHTDFMMEKANLMERALASLSAAPHFGSNSATVAFLDCDVTLLGPLPRLPSSALLSLSPHYIAAADEALFGKYNGGYVVASSAEVPLRWRAAAMTSRYFDQAALEDVAKHYSTMNALFEIPPQHNYGYWRLLQCASGDVTREASRFTIERRDAQRVVCYDGKPLRSIHTHLLDKKAANKAPDMHLFNTLVTKWLRECSADNAAYRALLSEM